MVGFRTIGFTVDIDSNDIQNIPNPPTIQLEELAISLKDISIKSRLNVRVDEHIQTHRLDSFAATLDSLNESSLSGFTSIQNCAKIVFKSSESLYSDIWSWIMFGFLSKKSNNNFFIKEEKNKTTVDMKRVPAFMSPNDALKIQQIGENVRLAKSRGLDFVFNNKENELFKTYNEMTAKVPVDGRSFQQFIESVRSIVSEQNWKYVMNEEGLKDHLRSLKMFYLTANDDFWTSFVSITSELVLNGHNRYKK
ncbi:unnamed protein product, partial [Medioppia subpectinata]